MLREARKRPAKKRLELDAQGVDLLLVTCRTMLWSMRPEAALRLRPIMARLEQMQEDLTGRPPQTDAGRNQGG